MRCCLPAPVRSAPRGGIERRAALNSEPGNDIIRVLFFVLSLGPTTTTDPILENQDNSAVEHKSQPDQSGESASGKGRPRDRGRGGRRGSAANKDSGWTQDASQ